LARWEEIAAAAQLEPPPVIRRERPSAPGVVLPFPQRRRARPRRRRRSLRWLAVGLLVLTGTAVAVIARGASNVRLQSAAGGPGEVVRAGAVVGRRPFPAIPAMERAADYLEQRAGHTAFAVVGSSGHEYGLNMHDAFVSASVVKAMLLVGYLRALARRHQHLDSATSALLYPMIHVSDNTAASSVWHIVGNAGLMKVAAAAGMKEFGLGADWANEQITAADQARFFFHLDRLVPRRFRRYALSLLGGIDSTQSWGIPAVARPRWRTYFKGGWRLTGNGQLVSQIGLLSRRGRRVAIAVMTDGDPSMGYGVDTVQGVAARLLGLRPA
jgi:hypothetical protein